MSDIPHGPLGEKSEYPQHYAPGVLYPIPRVLGRTAIGVAEQWPFHGEDVWNAYELSWLLPSGKPVVALLELRVPAHSPNIVESKSLKLYLGSFNQTVFETISDVEKAIAQDVSAVVGSQVKVQIMPFTASTFVDVVALPGECVDEEPATDFFYSVQPDLLRCESENVVSEILHSHLLRSCCPVTGQPDWASVVVEYNGPKMDRSALLRYIVSYRNNQEFHEQCVERIFTDLQLHCQPQQLTVYARYTRRGGIDINPWRSTQTEKAPNGRLVRQ